jgi:MFS family permease
LTANYWAVVRHFSRDIRLFLVAASLFAFSWDGIWSVLFNLYVLRLGFGPELVGLANGLGSLVFAVLALPAGALGTRWTSRAMLILGGGLAVLAFAALPLAEFVPQAMRPAWLVGVMVLAFGGMAFYMVNGLPFMMDASRLEERSHVFSVHIALLPAAAFVGSLLGGMLPGLFAARLGISPMDPAAYRYPLWLAALLMVPGVVALLCTRSRGEPVARSGEAAAGRAPYFLILMIALIMGLRSAGRGAVTTFFNVYLDGELGTSTALIGSLYALAQLLAVPAALVAPLLVARWGTQRIILSGLLGIAICTVPLALVPHWAVAAISFVSSTAFFFVSIGPTRLYSQELVAPRWRATMAAAFMLGAGVGFSGAGWVGGRLISSVGYQPLFLVGAGLAAASAVLCWLLFRLLRGDPTRTSDGRSLERG